MERYIHNKTVVNINPLVNTDSKHKHCIHEDVLANIVHILEDNGLPMEIRKSAIDHNGDSITECAMILYQDK